MSSAAHDVYYSYSEYVAFERGSNVKHEFLHGRIYGMAGGTPEHSKLAATVTGLLFPQLRGSKCSAYDSDLRVRTATGLTTYPDVTIICGTPARDAEDPLAITNPTLIVEVVSPSTERYDRGAKFEHYKSLASLQRYVLIAQERRSIEVRSRSEDGSWTVTVAGDGEVVELLPTARLDVGELYDAAAE